MDGNLVPRVSQKMRDTGNEVVWTGPLILLYVGVYHCSNIAPAEHVKATADSKIENNCGFRFAMHKNLAEFGNFTSLGFRKGGYELLHEKRLQALWISRCVQI